MTDTSPIATEPRVTVVIPCHDDGHLAVQAVESIKEPEPIEILVIDDASPDPESTAALAAIGDQPGVRVIRHEVNKGLIEARMTGLDNARGRYIFNLDADDLAIEGAIAMMADTLDSDPSCGVCYGDYIEFGTHSEARRVPEALDSFRLAYTNEYPVTALFRRNLLESVDGWRACGYRETAYEDWSLWITLAERGVNAVYLGTGLPTFRKRFHGHRMLAGARPRHPALYQAIRSAHPETFENLAALRAQSSLSAVRKVLYPIVYGGRRRYAWEPRVKRLLDRAGAWTLTNRSG